MDPWLRGSGNMMLSTRKTSVILALAALVATCALLPAAAGAATGRTVAVTASATVKVPNDTAKLGFGVKREKRTRGAALQATAKGLRKVIATARPSPASAKGTSAPAGSTCGRCRR